MAANNQIVICTFRVKAGKESAFRELVNRHWPTLNRLGLVEPQPRMIMRGVGKGNEGDLVEIFAWKERAFETAHTHPEVMAIWDPMEKLCEARGGRPAMEFPHFETIG
ncbi:MAG TPA: hypothetical protein VIX59_17830 [Candidatus Binataceae bacterium]